VHRSWPGELLFAAYWSPWSCIILHMGGYDTGPRFCQIVGSLYVCTVLWLRVNVIFSLWVFLVGVCVGSLCHVGICLNIISVGDKVYLSWVHFNTVYLSQLMSTHHTQCVLVTVSVFTMHSLCVSFWSVPGFPRAVCITSNVNYSQSNHCVRPTCYCRSFLSCNLICHSRLDGLICVRRRGRRA
jgi:hypothetical protein